MAGNSRTNILARVWTSCEETLKKILESRLFDCLVLFTVTISVISLAVEHHNQPERLTQVLWIADIICGVIFFVEMILKLLVSKGKYFINLYNIIDLVIIITSLNEFVTGKLPILRVLRVLRFLKLLQCMPYLQRKLGKLFGAVKKSPGFFLFLLCITFSFSTLGMLLFGGKFHFETVYGDIYSARKNFDTMELAMITVFEVYTKDSWNRVLYSAISSTSPWATLYFFMITMLGNYVVLNVLVGMVIQSFRSVPKPNTNLLPGPGPGPSRTPVTILAPDQHHALPDIIDESLTFIERIVRWFRNHMDWSLFMLSPRNRFRVFCQRVVFHSMFEIVFLVLIFLSYIPLIIERPGINPQSMERFFLKVSNYTFSAVFLVEMLLKVFAMGLFFGKDSYSRSGWNIMDGLLVILSLVHICISLVGTSEPTVLSTLRVFRVLRMLRSLRLIKRAPRLKLAVEALQASIKPISSVVLMCAAWLLFYATLGVQLFKGKFFHCLGQDITNITTKSDCLTAGYKWVRKPFNFDNTPQAMLSLFVMFSRSGWMTIMYDGLDAVGVDLQPIKDYNDWMHLYFISFMVVNFLLLDMFIGVMVETFRECHREQRRGDEAGDEQQQHRVQEPEDTQYFSNYPWLRRRIHTLCTSRFMELFTANVVFVSTIFMGLEHYNQPHYVGLIVQCSFGVFTVILIIEVLLRLVAFGVLRFMTDGWNLLDLLVVLFSLLKVIFHQLNMSRIIPINPGLFRVFRLLRLSQVLRNKRARILLSTVQKTILQVGSICFLFVFFFCIYAALGVQLFGRLVCTEDYRCLGINQYINFRHFGTALLALYQIATGDNWSGILKDTLKECPPDAYICSNFLSWVTPIYFISFVVMAQFTLLNLVIAAIMQALEDSTQGIQIGLSLADASFELLLICTIEFLPTLAHRSQRDARDRCRLERPSTPAIIENEWRLHAADAQTASDVSAQSSSAMRAARTSTSEFDASGVSVR
ncbi:voltage-dependent T-type calcium channel subunit alpha-1H-like [Halichoeres trimaculatus]|uniref:voltage-dependent T-type calcium channel subunit alpha-1H-like n=1 Tax=Halichoeres trimaculatus TaxID=147232 RepID=UPI003D9EEB4F